MKKRLADIDLSSWDAQQIDSLLACWQQTIKIEMGRKVHGQSVPPGAKLVLDWITQSRARIEKGEALEEIKDRVGAFLERLDSLEGIPTELPWETP